MLRSSLALLGSDFGCCLGQMRLSPIYRHQWNSLEPWRVPYKSRRFQNTLHNSMYNPMYKRSLEFSRKPWTPLMPSTIVQRYVDISRHLQNLPHSSYQWLSVDGSRSLQKFLGLYISLWGGSFEASCDTLPHLCRQRPRRYLFLKPLDVFPEPSQGIRMFPAYLPLRQSFPSDQILYHKRDPLSPSDSFIQDIFHIIFS